MAWYYRVPVVRDEEGIRPSVDPPYTVVQYLDDDTCVVKVPEPIDALEPLSAIDLDKLVTSPVHKILKIVDKLYGFKNIDGVISVGIDREGIICLRKEETFEVKYTDEEGNIVRIEPRTRIKLIRPPCDRVLAIRNGRLVVLDRTGEGWKEPTITITDPKTGETKEVPDPDPEIPVVGGGSIRFSEIVTSFVE